MTPVWRGGPLRVALISGVLVRHDAISNSLSLKLDLLRRLRDAGAPIEVTAFVRATDRDDPEVVTVHDVSDLARHPGFRFANVHLFEFGIYYDLFDAIFLLPERRRVLAVYHNITPMELVKDPAIREAVRRALIQKNNLVQAGRVICDSEYNRDDLLAFGLEPERLAVHHLPPARAALPRAVRRPDDPIDLVFLGRLVRPKGVPDLLGACMRLCNRGVEDFVVHLVGAPSFSEADVMAEARYRASRMPQVHFAGELDDEEIAALMSRADALVIPSYHEGYCVPVVEAYTAGCQVVAYDSTNLPNVVGDVGLLVPVGDVDGLTDALDAVIASGRSARAGKPVLVPTAGGDRPIEEWRVAVSRHLADYQADTYFEAFLAELAIAAGVEQPVAVA
jgi:glycosyltransferase involved in cell wall biosynthesis